MTETSDLLDRQALRRVPGLSTELEDITEVEYRQVLLERVVLVGVWTSGTLQDAERSLAELARLAETAGSVVCDGLVQRRERPDPATYIGAGKVRELRDVVVAIGADTVICDGELTPGQLRRLEEVIKVKVVDRTWLILDIFAAARAQPGGQGPGLAGPDAVPAAASARLGRVPVAPGGRPRRRRSRHRQPWSGRDEDRDRPAPRARLDLAPASADRPHVDGPPDHACARRANQVPSVVLAGYTNSGKSSLLNRLTGAGVLVEDALFATLDPTVRRANTPSGRVFTLADTVGFVRHLPHQLVEAFRSTLEEVAEADLVLHVVDGADAYPEDQISAVRGVLADVGAAKIPELLVINKSDCADPLVVGRLLAREPHAVVVSAATGDGIEGLLSAIDQELPNPTERISVLLPFTRGDLGRPRPRGGDVRSTSTTRRRGPC